jgi:hypothetical protein
MLERKITESELLNRKTKSTNTCFIRHIISLESTVNMIMIIICNKEADYLPQDINILLKVKYSNMFNQLFMPHKPANFLQDEVHFGKI